MLNRIRAATGMRVFLVIWFGQLVSLLGSGITGFALGIWTYQESGEVTQFAIVLFLSTMPPILLSPFAGLLADRWNRRWLMVLADTGAALSTLAIVTLLTANRLEPWHIYIATTFSAVMGSFQGPAYAASIPQLVSDDQLGRANGLGQLSRSISQLLAPILGGFLLVTIGLKGIILIDLITFLFAVFTLLAVRFPPTPKSTGHHGESWLRAAMGGWIYIAKRRGLLALLLYFAMINFLLGSIEVLVTPLALSITTPDILGVVLFIGGMGMLFGSLALTFWGGPKRKVYGVLAAQFIGAICILVVGFSLSVPVLCVVAFVYFFGIPIGDGCSTSIFQQKVAIDVQGRVFAAIGTVTGFILPISYLIISALADGVFEPLMMPGGGLAELLGPYFGVGKGRGIGLLFSIMGILAMLVTVLAYFYPPLRLIEDDLPNVNQPAAAFDSQGVNQPQGQLQ